MMQAQRIVGYLGGLAGPVAALARPAMLGVKLQSESHVRLEQLLPSILDRASMGNYNVRVFPFKLRRATAPLRWMLFCHPC
jgi:hypothetical protein